MGGSESISAHIVKANMSKCLVVNMHDKQGEYARNVIGGSAEAAIAQDSLYIGQYKHACTHM